MKRILCLITALLLCAGTFCGASAELSASDKAYLDKITEQMDGSYRSYFRKMYGVPGKKLEEKTPADFDANSPALYTAVLEKGNSIYPSTKEKDPTHSPSQTSPAAKPIFVARSDTKIEILAVGPAYLVARYGKKIGYVMRRSVFKETVLPLDARNTQPFNITIHGFIATAATECHVRSSMDLYDGNIVFTLEKGARLSVWKFVDGWAVVNMWKTYGYIDARELTDLLPVSPTDEPIRADLPIAAYTSYYYVPQHAKDKEHQDKYANRVKNITEGCRKVSVTIQPGKEFDDRKTMGPYRKYSFVGDLLGGGTCQVNSTLYNCVVKLPGLKITHRRPHGDDGACIYLPCHSDSAVGSDTLYFTFTNKYDFPIRIEAHASYGGALLIMIFREG